MAAHTIPTTRTECVHFVPPTKLPSRNSGMNQDFFYFILKQTKKKKREKRESLENERAHVCAQIYHRDPQVLLCLAAFLCVLTHLWNVADKFWRTWRQKKNVERFSIFLPKKKKMKRETGQKNVSCTVVTNDKCCHSLHHYLSYWVRILFFFFQKILLRVYFLSLFIATAKIKESMWAVVWDWNLKIKKGRTGTVK